MQKKNIKWNSFKIIWNNFLVIIFNNLKGKSNKKWKHIGDNIPTTVLADCNNSKLSLCEYITLGWKVISKSGKLKKEEKMLFWRKQKITSFCKSIKAHFNCNSYIMLYTHGTTSHWTTSFSYARKVLNFDRMHCILRE